LPLRSAVTRSRVHLHREWLLSRPGCEGRVKSLQVRSGADAIKDRARFVFDASELRIFGSEEDCRVKTEQGAGEVDAEIAEAPGGVTKPSNRFVTLAFKGRHRSMTPDPHGLDDCAANGEGVQSSHGLLGALDIATPGGSADGQWVSDLTHRRESFGVNGPLCLARGRIALAAAPED
jgi:hypothetical protein